MRDYLSTDLEGAAHYSFGDPFAGFDEGPSRAECGLDEREPNPRDDPYRGICGGCGEPVSAFRGDPGGQEGSCLWKGAAWHPSCRAADPDRPAILRGEMANAPKENTDG